MKKNAAPLVQLVRTSSLHGEDREFDSRRAYLLLKLSVYHSSLTYKIEVYRYLCNRDITPLNY